MFGKKKPQVAPDEDDAEARAKARRKKATRLPKGVKQLIGYDAMLRNGIASLGDGRWSATILFQDINYQLSPESHQMEIIDRWAKLINSFEAGQNVQIASYTRSRGVREILADVMMGETGDSLDHYRLDYNRLAQGKLESVSRNTSTVKTLTVTVRESDEQAAVATLNALCNNLVSQMRSIDACKATRLDREHRLRLMAEVLRPGEEFRFDERRFEHQPGKPDTKDLVCPWSIDARNPIQLDIESLDSKYLHRTMWVSSLPPELSDQLVNDLTGLRARVDVSIHLAPMDRGESMTLVRRKNAEVKMQIMDQRRKNRKQGLDPDDLPDDLADQQEQLGQLRDELRSTNQRLVDSIIVIGVSAASQEELEVACRNVKAKVNAQSCTAESLKFMQMEGLTAELPLGNNPLPMKRTLTTNSAAILIPFTTQEVFEPHGLFYGSNARSGNPILADRRSHMNSNGFVLGTSGGGKSFTVKQEIAGMFLNRDDEVIVIDPEREYLALAAAFGGQIIQISAGTGTRVNPMDIVLEDDSASDPVKDKTNNVVSMIGALIGGIDGLDPLQKGLVDQCVSNLYTRYRNQGGGVVQPTLQGEAGCAAVRGPVVEADVARIGHVADGQVESRMDGAVREVRVEDRGVRVQCGRDARADRIEFHARHVRFDVFGDAGHEIAGAAPGFQHLDGRGPDVERVPHGLDYWSGRVVGGQCGGARLRVLIVVEQFADLGVQVGPFGLVGECVRASAPSRVSAQRVRLLRGERLVAVPIERLECPNGGDVRFGAFAGRTRALRVEGC